MVLCAPPPRRPRRSRSRSSARKLLGGAAREPGGEGRERVLGACSCSRTPPTTRSGRGGRARRSPRALRRPSSYGAAVGRWARRVRPPLPAADAEGGCVGVHRDADARRRTSCVRAAEAREETVAICSARRRARSTACRSRSPRAGPRRRFGARSAGHARSGARRSHVARRGGGRRRCRRCRCSCTSRSTHASRNEGRVKLFAFVVVRTPEHLGARRRSRGAGPRRARPRIAHRTAQPADRPPRGTRQQADRTGGGGASTNLRFPFGGFTPSRSAGSSTTSAEGSSRRRCRRRRHAAARARHLHALVEERSSAVLLVITRARRRFMDVARPGARGRGRRRRRRRRRDRVRFRWAWIDHQHNTIRPAGRGARRRSTGPTAAAARRRQEEGGARASATAEDRRVPKEEDADDASGGGGGGGGRGEEGPGRGSRSPPRRTRTTRARDGVAFTLFHTHDLWPRTGRTQHRGGLPRLLELLPGAQTADELLRSSSCCAGRRSSR